MELSKGHCFCCDSDKVILQFEFRKVRKIICSLFSNDLMNVEVLDNVLSCLKICPFCYHKLLILWRTNKNLLSSISKTKNSKCLMCREGDVLFQISKWPHFKTISEDVKLENKDKYQMCSECLFYLDVRYTFKKTILNKYPELKPKPKLKLKIQKVVPSPSILKVENGKSSKKYKRLRFSDVDESIDIPISTPVIDFSAIQGFKPLKHSRPMKKSNLLNNDPKFIDQIPYVLLKVTNLTPNRENVIMIQSDTEDEVITTSSPTKGLKIKFKTKRKKSTKQLFNESIEINSKPEIVETVLQKCDFKKDLIINLPKIPETINNKYDGDDSVRRTKKNKSVNKSTDDSTVLTNNSQLISEKNAKEGFPESSSEEKEHFKNKDTTVESESEKFNLALDESEEEKTKRKKYRPKPLSKKKNKNAELPEDLVNQAKKDKCCEDLEKPNIDQPIEIRNNVDDPGNEDLKQNTDDSENTENMGEEKDSLNSDSEEIVDRSSESTQNANEDLNDKNDGIEENDKETQESLSMDEDNKDESENEKTSNNASIDDKESETDITPEENKDEPETEKTTSNNASIDDNESETDITPEETVDNGDVDDDRKDVEDNEEGVDDNREDFEDKTSADDKLADHNSEEAENTEEGSDDENKEQEVINNDKPIKEQNNTSSNTDQQETVESDTNEEISDVDKENINDIISLLATNDDKISDTEEKESGNVSENEASNNSGCKRKYDDNDEEINTNGNAEKKKKKVTFSEDK